MNDFDLNSDIDAALIKYNKLERISATELRGEVDLKAGDLLLHTFKVSVTYPESFPFSFPKVKELGGDIDRTIHRHVFPKSGNLCLGVVAEERILCMRGITTLKFLDRVLIPRLADEYRVMNGEDYSKGYSHNNEGNWEFFFHFFDTNDKKLVLSIFKMAITNQMPKTGNDCPCGKKKHFSRCHRGKVYELQSIINVTGADFWIEQCQILISKSQ